MYSFLPATIIVLASVWYFYCYIISHLITYGCLGGTTLLGLGYDEVCAKMYSIVDIHSVSVQAIGIHSAYTASIR